MSSGLFLFAAPTDPVLDLDDVKTHLRVDGTDDDELIVGLIQAAMETVETCTHRAIKPQTWDWKLPWFPAYELWLPKPPVTSVTSITYLDTAGASQTWAAANYLTDLPTGPWARKARIVPAYSVVYPSTYPVPNAVTVRFVCGYPTANPVPESLKAAMKLLIGHWYENREAVTVGTLASPLPLAVDALLWPFKAF